MPIETIESDTSSRSLCCVATKLNKKSLLTEVLVSLVMQTFFTVRKQHYLDSVLNDAVERILYEAQACSQHSLAQLKFFLYNSVFEEPEEKDIPNFRNLVDDVAKLAWVMTH